MGKNTSALKKIALEKGVVLKENTSALKKIALEKGVVLKEKSRQKIEKEKDFWQGEWNQLDLSAKRLIGIVALVSVVSTLFFWKEAPSEPIRKAWRYQPHQKKAFVCIGETNQPTLFWEKFVRETCRQDYFAGYNLFVVGFPDIPDSGTFSSLTFGADSLSKALSLPLPESSEKKSLLDSYEEIVLCGYALGNFVIKKYLVDLAEKQNESRKKIQQVFFLGPDLHEEQLENWCYSSGISVSPQEFNSLKKAYQLCSFSARTHIPASQNETKRPYKLALPSEVFLEINREVSEYSQRRLLQDFQKITQELSEQQQEKETALQEIQQRISSETEQQKQLNQLQHTEKELKAQLLVQQLVLEGVLWNSNAPKESIAMIQGEPKKAGDTLEKGILIVAIQKDEVLFFIDGNHISKKAGDLFSNLKEENQQQQQRLEQLTAEKLRWEQEKATLEKEVKELAQQKEQISFTQQEIQQQFTKKQQEYQALSQEKEALQQTLQSHQVELEKVNKTLASSQKNEKKLEETLKKLEETLKKLQESYQVLSGSKQQWQETIKQNERLNLLNEEANQKLILREQNINLLKMEITKLLRLKDISSASPQETIQIRPSDVGVTPITLQDIPEANQLYLEAQNALNANKTPFAAFVGAGQISEAKEKYHKLLELYAHSTKAEIAAYELATLYFEENAQSNGALDLFKQCLSINPNTSLDVRLKLGLLYEAQLKGPEARFWYNEAIQKSSNKEERTQAQQRVQQLKDK